MRVAAPPLASARRNVDHGAWEGDEPTVLGTAFGLVF